MSSLNAPKPLKIIQIIQKPQLRGAEIFACQLSNHLLEAGNEVIVVSIFKGDAELPFQGQQYHLNRSVRRRFFDISGWRKFNNIIRSFSPDIVQANAADTLKFAVSSKILFNWEAVVVFRNANKMGDFINSWAKWFLNKFYLSEVDHVISVSEECEKDLRKTFKYPKKKISTVEIGVEENDLGQVPKDLAKIFAKGSVITHIGGFVPEKNHEELIDIFLEVWKANKNLQLLLLGKGKLRARIQEKVRQNNLSHAVHFLGYRTDVLDILKHSTVFVLPSLIEGLPAVILEAMYATTPVIAYNVGGISEIVKPETGWLIIKNDKENFIRALQDVLHNPTVSQNRVLRAKKMVTEKFHNKVISERFSVCYNNLLNKSFKEKKKRKLKIIQIVTRRQYRGAELFAADLSTELVRLGHEVMFVGIYESKDDVLEVEGIKNIDLTQDKKGAFSIETTRRLIRLINNYKPDIIQCNGSDTLKYTVASSFFNKRIPIVYRNISIISEWISSKPKKFVYKKMFDRIAHVTSVGDEALADFIETYNFPKSRAEVIRRGVPIKTIDKNDLPTKLRKDLGLSSSTKIATHIGNFSTEKNHEFLLDVFSKLIDDHPEIKLLCVGSGELFGVIKKQISQRGLENTIFLLGFRKDIPSLLAASDCLVLSSRVEGVPGVILEAGIQRTPSIATNVGGVSEVVVDGETGFLINDFDQIEFRTKLIEMMANDRLRKEMGQKAYDMISKGYDPTENAKQFENLYLSLV